MANVIEPAAEFSKLNLEEIVATPLIATVKAQAVAAEATAAFVKSMIDPGTNRPRDVTFRAAFQEQTPALPQPTPAGGGAPGAAIVPSGTVRSLEISAPLLSIVPIPHLRIDSLTVNFQYQVNQVLKDEQTRDANASIEIGSGAALSPWVKATLKGTVATRSAQESTTNRSGTLDITVHASEAPMPEGLAKLLSILASSITAKAV